MAASDLNSIGKNIRSEPRCKICQSQSRVKVDKLLALQFSYVSVAEELMESDAEFNGKELDTVRKNVERHAKRHLDLHNRAVREMVERRAKEQGVMLDSVRGKISNSRALLDLIVAKGQDQAADPNSKVRYADAIEAAKMLEDIQKQEYLAELETMQRQVFAISQAVKEICPPTLLPGIVDRAKDIFEKGDEELLELEA